MSDILDDIEIADDAAGLKLKATVGIFLWDRRAKVLRIFMDIDTYKNEAGVYGDKLTGNLELDPNGKYKSYELSLLADNEYLIDAETGLDPTETTTITMGEYDFLDMLGNAAIDIKSIIAQKIQIASSKGRLK